MFWAFRYKQPQGVKDVIIETQGDTVEEATALGQWFVDAKCPGPGYRFIAVHPWCVATWKDKATLEAEESGAQKADAKAPRAGREPIAAGRIGA